MLIFSTKTASTWVSSGPYLENCAQLVTHEFMPDSSSSDHGQSACTMCWELVFRDSSSSHLELGLKESPLTVRERLPVLGTCVLETVKKLDFESNLLGGSSNSSISDVSFGFLLHKCASREVEGASGLMKARHRACSA
mmetsp:Transcript_100527/g.189570  ORF Transcript_100527/g.189570 Transcript_100527/m.189570 type:complete len:138 (+) Transcript_100527:129-542(+)